MRRIPRSVGVVFKTSAPAFLLSHPTLSFISDLRYIIKWVFPLEKLLELHRLYKEVTLAGLQSSSTPGTLIDDGKWLGYHLYQLPHHFWADPTWSCSSLGKSCPISAALTKHLQHIHLIVFCSQEIDVQYIQILILTLTLTSNKVNSCYIRLRCRISAYFYACVKRHSQSSKWTLQNALRILFVGSFAFHTF